MDNNIGIPDQFIIELPWPDGIPCIRISMGCPTVLAVEPGGVGVGQHKVFTQCIIKDHQCALAYTSLTPSSGVHFPMDSVQAEHHIVGGGSDCRIITILCRA